MVGCYYGFWLYGCIMPRGLDATLAVTYDKAVGTAYLIT